MASQATSHRKPSAPVATNATRHPYVAVTHATRGGVTIAPAFVPELKIPVAKARSFLGNHSATALIEAGKLPDSPNPKAKRATPKPKTDLASAWAIAARLQKNTEREKPLRVPSQSMTLPAKSSATAYASW